MAARIPRRTFATPLIALAAAPSCFVSSSTPPSQPVSQAAPGQPEQSDPQPNTPPPSQSPVIISNPPRPRPQPDQPPPPPPVVQDDTPKQQPVQNQRWTVIKTSTGCEAVVEVSCPQGAMCNPPAPMKYACPTGVTLPAKIMTFGDGCALEQAPTHCPPKAMCNPPPPHKVACPTR